MVRSKFPVISIVVTVLLASVAYGQRAKTKLYVWDFASKTQNLDNLAERLTDEFEEALIKSNCYQVLERKVLNRLKRHAGNEKMVQSLDNLSSKSMQELMVARAEAVVFGTVDHDVDSGQYKISVSLQRFDSTKMLADSVRIGQGKIKDGEIREKAMSELVNKLCPTIIDTSSDQSPKIRPREKTTSQSEPAPDSAPTPNPCARRAYPVVATHPRTGEQAVAGEIVFECLSCKASGISVICDFIVKNESSLDKSISIYVTTQMHGVSGYRYDWPTVVIGNERNPFLFPLPSNVRTKALIGFNNVGSEEKEIALLHIKGELGGEGVNRQQFEVRFKNIAITR